MRIGIDTGSLILRDPGSLAPSMKSVCERMFRDFPEHAFTIFCTPFNRSLLVCEEGTVRFVTLPSAAYLRELDRAVARQNLDVLIRVNPADGELRFPRARQIVLIPSMLEDAPAALVRALVDECRRVASLADAADPPLTLREGTRPLVSIVTPSLNQGRFLRRTIESVLGQTYPEIEYIVVDGGSTDESVGILQSYGARFRWLSEPDGGQTQAINKGMAMAHGEILGYLNSDDVLLPESIARAVAYFQHHPDWDMLYGNADFIDEDDRVVRAYPTDEYSFERLLADCMICQPACFWRRRLAERLGPFDERLDLAMDYDFWLRADRLGARIHMVPDRLAQSRLHADAKTLTAGARIYRECITICDRHAGRVAPGFFYGYWHHHIHELTGFGGWLLRRLPLDHIEIAWLHHRWYHGARYFARELGAHFADWVSRSLGLQRLLGRTSPAGVSTTRGSGRLPVSVKGAFADGYLGPKVTIDTGWAKPGEVLHLAGIALVDTTVVWDADGTELGRMLLKTDQYARIEVRADALAGKPLNIRFSNSIRGDANRRRSLLLQDTNLFTEADVL